MLLGWPPAGGAPRAPRRPDHAARPGPSGACSCEGRSVFRGTAIETFNVEILDVIDAGPAGSSGPRSSSVSRAGRRRDRPRLRASRARPDPDAVRNAGAISAGLGEYGNDAALATPIEGMLGPAGRARGRPARPRAAASRASAGRRRSPSRGSPARRRARSAGRPARRAGRCGGAGRPRRRLQAGDLQPGSAASVEFSTGDLGLSAIGTVDIPRRRRHLGLRPPASTARAPLAPDRARSSTRDPEPPRHARLRGRPTSWPPATATRSARSRATPLDSPGRQGRARAARDPAAHRRSQRHRGRLTLDSLLADERELGYGAGLSFVAPLGVTQALGRLMRDSAPSRSACAPVSRCASCPADGVLQHVLLGGRAVNDFSQAGGMIDFFDLAPLQVQRAEVGVRARRHQAGRPHRRARAAARARGRAHPGAADRAAPPQYRYELTVPVRIPARCARACTGSR